MSLSSHLRQRTSSCRSRKGRRSSTYRPRLELLESRLAPAVHTWTGGGGANNHWSDADNWSGGVPTAGESNVSLIFSAGLSDGPLTETNNDITGLNVGAIQFSERILSTDVNAPVREPLAGYVL